MFADRKEAGVRLAKKLASFKKPDTIVLGLPRGGVVVAREVAKALRLPLDIIIVRKVGHPSSPEVAICALDETGTMMCGEIASIIDAQWLSRELRREQDEAERRAHVYRGKKPPLDLTNKTAIIVDDGVATGLTAGVAIAVARRLHAKRIVFAAPVIAQEAARELMKVADDVVMLEKLDPLIGAVGGHYVQFPQLKDKEVIDALVSPNAS